MVGYHKKIGVSRSKVMRFGSLKGCSGADVLVERTCRGAMVCVATGGAKMDEAVVTLAPLQLESDANVTSVFGLETMGRADTAAEGGDGGVGKDTTIALFVVMVVSTKTDNTEGGSKRDGGRYMGVGSMARKVFNIGS